MDKRWSINLGGLRLVWNQKNDEGQSSVELQFEQEKNLIVVSFNASAYVTKPYQNSRFCSVLAIYRVFSKNY